jgi:protein-S-isoprenylcysteine O-methyltransferase Ste14
MLWKRAVPCKLMAMAPAAADPRRFPFPPAIPIAALLLSWLAGRLWPIPVTWPAWTAWVGWTLLTVPFAVAAAAIAMFRRHHTPVNPRGHVTMIVAEGPFRFTRNPMYVSLLLSYLGGMLAFRLPWAALFLVLVFLALDYGVIRPEEQHLEAAFGDPYILYKRRVRRWL